MTNDISSGVISSGLTVSGFFNQIIVSSGGSAVDVTVISSAELIVNSGGSVTDATATSFGNFVVSSGGFSISSFVISNASAAISGETFDLQIDSAGVSAFTGSLLSATSIDGSGSLGSKPIKFLDYSRIE